MEQLQKSLLDWYTAIQSWINSQPEPTLRYALAATAIVLLLLLLRISRRRREESVHRIITRFGLPEKANGATEKLTAEITLLQQRITGLERDLSIVVEHLRAKSSVEQKKRA